MGSPVSPIVANLYMEEVEHRALSSFTGTVPSHWFRYVDDTWVIIQTKELEVFSVLTHTAHWNTSWVGLKHYNIGLKQYLPQPRGYRKNIKGNIGGG